MERIGKMGEGQPRQHRSGVVSGAWPGPALNPHGPPRSARRRGGLTQKHMINVGDAVRAAFMVGA